MEDERARVEEPVPPEDRVTLAGLKVAESPDGDAEAESETVPEKLFRLVKVIMDVAELPDVKLILDGLVEIEKSPVGVVVLKNSVIAAAPASPVDMVARFQFVSTVLVNE